MRILIMGLPGSGKSTLAEELHEQLHLSGLISMRINADEVRTLFNDWDFSHRGRLNQARRMKLLSEAYEPCYVICDFVAPLAEARDLFQADFTVWVDTITTDIRFPDTISIFEEPIEYDIKVDTQDAKEWAKLIAQSIVDID